MTLSADNMRGVRTISTEGRGSRVRTQPPLHEVCGTLTRFDVKRESGRSEKSINGRVAEWMSTFGHTKQACAPSHPALGS